MKIEGYQFLGVMSEDEFLALDAQSLSPLFEQVGRGTVVRTLGNIGMESDSVDVRAHSVKLMDAIEPYRTFYMCPKCLFDAYGDDLIGQQCPVCQIQMEPV